MILVNEQSNDEAKSRSQATKTRTIFVECTHTYHSDINTGIQRVVRNVLRNAPFVAAKFGMQVVPVIVENSRYRIVDAEPVLRNKQTVPSKALVGNKSNFKERLWSARSYLRGVLRALLSPFPREFYWYLRNVIAAALPFAPVRHFLWAPQSEFGLSRFLTTPIRILRRAKPSQSVPAACFQSEAESAFLSEGVTDRSGDVLLLLDSSWSVPLWNATQAFKQQNGIVIGVIYDLIPVTHPHACVRQLTTAFSDWLWQYCRISDGTITISKYVKRQFQTYAKLCGLKKWTNVNAPVRYFHLGSELDLAEEATAVSPRIAKIFDRAIPTFLAVGSIEPRKNHAFVLEAFEHLWAANQSVRLVIVGKQAWRTEELLKYIGHHVELEKNLFIFRDATDAELEQCYRCADALVIASEVEGFGLPIVEAFQRKLPVICSDIPVFREIGGSSVMYFDLSRPEHLSGAIQEFLLTNNRTAQPSEWMTWGQSTDALFTAINEIIVELNANDGQTAQLERNA